MAEVLIARFKNKREADLIAQLIGTMPKAKVLQKGKNLEDMYFAELINEGMKEKGTVSLAAFKKGLQKRIAKKSNSLAKS
jgi:plasmid rolling circle replication initiator protein Rep